MSRRSYRPSAEEQHAAEEGYIRYAAGVSIIADPQTEAARSIHRLSLEHENLEIIVVKAEELMVGGLREVIRFANPKDVRSHMNTVEKQFEEALPHMIATVDRVFERHNDRMTSLHPAFTWLHPEPMTNDTLFKYICHPHYPKLKTARLLDMFWPSPLLAPIVDDKRTLTHLSSAPQSRSA